MLNVSDNITYRLWFDNNKGLWNIGIEDSPNAVLTPEQYADFFKCDMFKKISKRTYYFVTDAKKTYTDIVKEHIEHGEMIDVDVVKLDAILHYID